MKKSLIQTTMISLGVFVAAGCAITDYDGIGGHKTAGEAKLWGQEVSFSGFGGGTDGTYSYTVKYDNSAGQGPVTINSYKNPVVSSFSRDGLVNRDGDDVQGRAGDIGGKFLPWVKAVDTEAGVCGFDANVTFDKEGNVGVYSCYTGFLEENDKDLDLQAAFGSLDDLFGSIWSGALYGNFTMDITALNINGVAVPVEMFSVHAFAESLRPSRFLIDGTQPNAAAFIEALLANTRHLEPVNLGVTFAGGMTFNLPNGATLAFNHDVLWGLLEN